MDKISSSDIGLPTPRGNVRIRSFCSPQEIRNCTFDRQFAFHVHYKSFYTNRELLEKAAEQPDANIVLALAEQNHIIGYAVLAYPDPGERWAELGPEIMMEVKAIEVCRSWRSCKMLIKLFEPHGFKEYQTNEPNVCLKSENLFMCRVGNNIRQVILDRFKWLRFGLSPWTWKVSGY